MGQNVAQKLIASHLVSGEITPGMEIGLKINQTLTQDAAGTLVMLELEAMQLDRVKTELSVQYVDPNQVQADFRNADDHLYLRSACRKFGVWYSRPGNGVSHPVHMERFGVPGKTLLGSDSHTPAAGALGMLAIGAGGLEVAMAMAGEPYYQTMPKIMGVRLNGTLPDWVSAMDRHVIANMGTELGATSTVFSSDDNVRLFLKEQGREDVWEHIEADPDAGYDEEDEIDLNELVPLISCPSSPGNVVPVAEVAGKGISISCCMQAQEFTRQVATVVSVWGRFLQAVKSVCEPYRAIFPAAPEQKRIRFISVARKLRQLRHLPA